VFDYDLLSQTSLLVYWHSWSINSNNEDGISTKILNSVELTASNHILKVQVELGETELFSFNFKNLNNTSTEEFAITRNIHVDLWPNPFNPSTNLCVYLPSSSRTEISVYDVNGRLISTLNSGVLSVCEHTFQIQAQNWPSGIYLYSVKTESEVKSGKMVLIK